MKILRIINFIKVIYTNSVNLNKDYENCLNICDQKMEIANESYYTIDSQIKKLNDIIEFLQKEIKTAKQNDTTNATPANKQLQELINFENFLNSNNK